MKQFLFVGLICASVVVVACAPQPEKSSVDELHALFDEAWDFQMQENPLWATAVGLHEYNDRLPSLTIEDEERRAEYYRGVLDRLHAIDRDGLDAAERINYDMFERRLSDWLTGFEFKGYLIPITAESGFHTGFARLPERVPLRTTQDYENYIARLRAFPLYTEQHIEIMREGIANGYVLPQVVLQGYESTIEPHLVEDTSQSVFWKPFESFPNAVPEAEHERLRQAGLEAIRDDVIPAYRAWYRFILDEYVPSASSIIGASALPNGREYYEFLVRHHTTLDITPQEVHDIGLAEVARIRAEMEAIIEEVGFEGTFAEFLDFLRTDPQILRRHPRGAAEGGLLHRQDHGRQAAHLLQDAAAAALRRRAGAGSHRAEVHGGPLRRSPSRQHAAGLLLGQYLCPGEPAALGTDRRSPSTRPSPGTTCRTPSDRSWKACPTSVASLGSMPTAKAGASTASASGSKPGCTRPRMSTSVG